MIIENYLIINQPSIKEQVIVLKKNGMKTEPAFCKVLDWKETHMMHL